MFNLRWEKRKETHADKVAGRGRKSCQKKKGEGGEDFREETPQKRAADRGRSTEEIPRRRRQGERHRRG